MTKDVLIKVRGYQYLAGEGEGLSEDPEVTEMITWGHYYPKGEHHYIRYEEKMEGFSETIDNLIRLDSGGWRLFAAALAAAVIMGGVIELMQETLTACRSGDWMDFAADAIGALAGAALGRAAIAPLFARWGK